MSPVDELRMFGWAIGGGLFLSLLLGVTLRLRTALGRRRGLSRTALLLAWQRDANSEARRLSRRRGA